MESSQLRRKDTTKGPPLRVLTLDGGGVRGYSMLIILQELMYRTYVECEGKAPRRDQIPKPCDHFDLITGTGTGGLIAIMLGRLRLDLETCKDVYVRMTRRVFETDKTFAGIPYRSTLFKASKLEDAIRTCVREHTVFESEGNDGTPPPPWRRPGMQPLTSPSTASVGMQRRLSKNSVASSRAPSSPISPNHNRGSSFGSINGTSLWGNPDAPLYDDREFRTKTAVTAVYKGTPKNGPSVLLRSYDSRREPPPEYNCTIWEAGRATAATGLAFKPIQIGQHVFIDEGVGKYNSAPQVLDEATVNEWPGREVGVFVSVGTGKRPPGTGHQQHEWWEDFFGDTLGNFAEAKRQLIAKIEGCEKTHQYMLKEHLAKRNVPRDNYYRLNVEVGVGEFGMNEWNRLVEISTNTRMYLSKDDVQKMSHDSAVKLARIQKANQRLQAHSQATAAAADFDPNHIPNRPAPPLPPRAVSPPTQPSSYPPPPPPPVPPPPPPHPSETAEQPVFELPAELPPATGTPPSQNQRPPGRPRSSDDRVSSQDKYTIITSDEYPEPVDGQRVSMDQHSQNSQQRQSPPRNSGEVSDHSVPPPLPPKTPIPFSNDKNTTNTSHAHTTSNTSSNPPNPNSNNNSPGYGRVKMPDPLRVDRPVITTTNYDAGNGNGNGSAGQQPAGRGRGKYELPYPPDDGPPPVVNRRRKPTYKPRS